MGFEWWLSGDYVVCSSQLLKDCEAKGYDFMLSGTKFHSMDTKGRLILPADFREAIGDKFIATRGFENCIWIFSIEEYDKLEEKIKKLPEISGRELYRFIIGSKEDCENDKQGRVLIPLVLREHASLEKDIVVVGQSTKVEIWDKRVWTEHNNNNEEKAIALLEGIGI